MNRLFSLSLALLLLLTGCVGRAAPPADDGAPLQTEEITATANQAPEIGRASCRERV